MKQGDFIYVKTGPRTRHKAEIIKVVKRNGLTRYIVRKYWGEQKGWSGPMLIMPEEILKVCE